MLEMILVFSGLAMSFIVYPVLLIESKRGDNVRITRLATSVNLAGVGVIMVGLVVALLNHLL